MIRSENILHEKTDNGKVYMKVLFEVEQSIVKEEPLVYMQGE
jgi:similar to stage IV sporulation protein